MKRSVSVGLGLLVFMLAACGGGEEHLLDTASRHTSFDGGVLFLAEQWGADNTAGVYVLALEPDFTHAGSSWGGNLEEMELEVDLYREQEMVRSFAAQVSVKREIRFDDRAYDLRDGNMFGVSWSDSGDLQSEQIRAFIEPAPVPPRIARDARTDADLLGMFQQQLAADHVAQALAVRR